jgi:ABC-type branched-subunit amino acid transport system substrate-binding protein
MEVLASYLIYWRNIHDAAIITDFHGDGEYTRGISRNFTQAMNDSGGKVTLSVTIQPDAVLLEEQISSLLMTEPQAIMVAAGGRRAAQWVKKLRAAGFAGVICGPDSWDDAEFIAGLDGVEPGECIYTAFFHEGNDSPEFLEFRKEFRKKFYHYPTACETQSYDALIFLCIGLNNVDNILDFDRNWRNIRNFRGAAATYTMLAKGGIDRTVYLKSIGVNRTNGKVKPYARLSRQMQYSKIKDYRIIE